MGSAQSGNRRPKRRAAPEDKSRAVTIRLNPRREEHRWALAYLEQFDREQLQVDEASRWTRGDLIVDALMTRAGVERTEPTVIARAEDVLHIRQIVEYLMDKVESGELGSGARKQSRRREPAVMITAELRETVDRYVQGGLSAADDLDEDE